MKDSEIELSAEHPEADLAHIVRGKVRRGLKPVTATETISLQVDADVIAWFQEQGPGWQTRLNAALREFKETSATRSAGKTGKAASAKPATP